jgi:hypothetical protein
MKKLSESRRNFLKNGTKAVAGTMLAAHGILSDRANAGPYPPQLADGSPGDKIIGCYSSNKEILENPKYIDALQEKLGVNVLLAGSPVKMPGWLREMNPLTGKYSMFAQHTDDDTETVKAIEETHRRGMKYWLYFSGHHNSADERDVMSETFDGVKFADLPPIRYALSQGEITTCFEKPRVKNYVQQLFGHASRTYNVDSMYVSHTRYATPSFWTNLFGCACSDCRKAAERKGYDFEQMKKSMMNLRQKLESLDRKTLEHVAKFHLTLTDFLAMLGEDDSVLDWLYFRSSIVGDALRRMHDIVHASTDHRCGFVSDTHNPTMAFLVGHNFEDLINGGSDGLHPLSWCAYQHISIIAAWANQLCEWVDGLEEATALRIVTAFFGWDELGLPDKKISDLSIGNNSSEHKIWSDASDSFYGYFNPDLTEKLMTHEWTRMAAKNRGRIPTHPCIKGYEWPEKVCRRLIEKTEDLGLSGYIFQRTETLIDRDRL